jgi:translation initiation factor IF-3
VRVIGADGNQLGVMTPQEAMRIADGGGLDLVEISPTANPPVCRIMNFGKYKYDLDLKHREARKKQTHSKIKEVKFHPNVADHDYQTKLNHILEFLKEGHRVRCSLQFRGRETSHTELGFVLFHRIQEDIKAVGHAEQRPNLQGRLLSMMLMANKDGKVAVVPPLPDLPAFRLSLPMPGGVSNPGPRPPVPSGPR